MKLRGGPQELDGQEATLPASNPLWVLVAHINGGPNVFDVHAPDVKETLNKVGHGGWNEFRQDKDDENVYRWIG